METTILSDMGGNGPVYLSLATQTISLPFSHFSSLYGAVETAVLGSEAQEPSARRSLMMCWGTTHRSEKMRTRYGVGREVLTVKV